MGATASKVTRCQKPAKGRERISAGAIKQVRDEINRASRMFGVSKSFVIMSALADHFGVEEQERYLVSSTKRWRRPVLLKRA